MDLKAVEILRATFKTGKTLPYDFRFQQLNKLALMIENHTEEIVEAVFKDFKRPKHETLAYDILASKIEISTALRCLKDWMKPEKLPINALMPLDRIFMQHDPYGVVLILGTWNFPFCLVVQPLCGAIAAGNCAIIKPSEITACCAAKFAELLPMYLDSTCYRVVQGGIPETTELLKEKFDYIFATGSTSLGRVIMKAASEHLTPVTLELGGKSPVYIDDNVDIRVATKRILWGKFINAGQVCISPDFIICSKKVEHEFIELAKQYLMEFFGTEQKFSPDLSRIVNLKNFKRLNTLLKKTNGKIAIGGDTDAADLWISPTIVVDVRDNDILMQDEIFGPILPFRTVESSVEAFEFINSRPAKPLALYIFSQDQEVVKMFVEKTRSGNICVNDVVLQCGAPGIPFGGVGESGMGNYHGKYTYDTFTHRKGILAHDFSTIVESMLSIRYPPYKNTNFVVAITYFIFKYFHYFNIPYLRLTNVVFFVLGILFTYALINFAEVC